MEVLELNGVRYVKASRLARDLGYTSDYIGQLCRSGKIAAQLVGRAWYVEEKSIQRHKGARYRSTKAKTSEAFKKTKAEETSLAERHISVNRDTGGFNYNRQNRQKASATYSSDEADLLPVVPEKERRTQPVVELEVEHPDAQKLPVKKTEQPFFIQAAEREPVAFSGTLTITAVQEEPETTKEEINVSPEPSSDVSEVNKIPLRKEQKNVIAETSKKADLLERKIPLRRSGVISMTQPKHHLRTKELAVESIPDESPVLISTHVAAYVVSAILLGVSLSFAVVFLQSEISFSSADSDTHESSFSFRLPALLLQFYERK